MALTFRYRYVDVGTVFTGDSRLRDADNRDGSPATLFANEVACDVGGSAFGPNQPLAILDHHLASAKQFPSASAAVLHKSALLRDRFSRADHLVWLVTNNQPEFDAFCSLYLARWTIQDPAAEIDWRSYGLDPDGWTQEPRIGKFDWFQPDLTGIPWEHRWPLLLAGYASMVEMRRPIACPRARALRSLLYAALKRGRDYMSETSGAKEFFDEARACIQREELNPVFDSVLEGSPRFAPELAMLDREAENYDRDLERARKALVFLPEAEAPTPDFFQHPRNTPQELDGQSLLLADSFRIATDGIYLRDPDCALFKEWARVDLENSALGAGFEFTALAYSNRRAQEAANSSEYVFSIDPERANGRHLYTVWSRLQTEEVEALRAGRDLATLATGQSGQRTHTLETLLSDPWLGGHNQSSTYVETPRRGTLIGPAGVSSDLRDDPVVEAVRTELEAPIYSTVSPITGPQISVHDLPATADGRDEAPRQFDMNAPMSIPPPQPGYFRFAAAELRPDVPIAPSGVPGERLARQIGETLWHALHPDGRGAIPQDFARYLVVAPDEVGVWDERGIAVAQKARAPQGVDADDSKLRDFTELISLVRDVDQFAVEWKSTQDSGAPVGKFGAERKPADDALQLIASDGEDLARRVLELQHFLTQPGRDLQRRFCEAIGFEHLGKRLYELNQTIAERLRRQQAEEESRRREARALQVAQLRGRLKWLELFVIGFAALEIIGLVARNVSLGSGAQQMLVWLGGPLVLIFAAFFLQPWRLKRSRGQKDIRLEWILLPALLVWIAAWLAQVLSAR
jgi:hypothetical protein